MSKTLVLMFHPNFASSTANAALARAAQAVDGVELVDVAVAYPDGNIDMMTDGAAEAQRLLTADRIVLQFPMQWYSVPSLLKEWIDVVLMRMYYGFPEEEGARLAGTPLMIAATAGNTPENYQPGGQIGIALDEIFTPLRATAIRAGMPWHKPHFLYRANKLTPEQLAAAGSDYQAVLRAFIAAAPAKNSGTQAA